jgi:hypothetical protein
VEDKHDVLSRGPRSLLDHDLKPNSDEKKKLEVSPDFSVFDVLGHHKLPTNTTP